ncbi:PREDICTED: uncharacterized protein LOC105148801 isoform X2 [Acromyrmex echinatior]|uniref:uncharacterized protein LOC105148801 isoform X2 n=1 Tax=Acromyrmex echinatior TaxID=103372 RepID=UPI000580DE63|nr:PREDICTED: uncharacterized protein LOC105148801 isoform X2 [Acromyrmex echinatior]
MGDQDEIRTLLLSLLVSRKDAIPVVVLERDYYNMEKKRIPYRKFSCNNLVQFLQSMPEHFIVEEANGGHYVRGIADKSKHVSSLVSRQKNSSNKNLRTRYSSRQATTFNRRIQHARIPIRIPNGTLIDLIDHIKTHPNGMSLQNALLYVQAKIQHVLISHQDLRAQLREVTHQLCIDGNMIYAIQNGLQSNVAQQPSNQQSLLEESSIQLRNESELSGDSISLSTQQTEYPAGEENFELDYFDDEDEDYFVSPYSKNNIDNCQKRPKTSEMLATNLAQHVKSEQTDMFNYSKSPDDNEIFESLMTNSNCTEMRATECPQDKSEIVSDRIKARLEKLLQKYPDGIWCAELPDIYLKEYKVHLNYSNLGFTSVREFTSYLPKIFYMTQVNKTDDFKLYSADKRPVVPKAESINETSHNHQYDEHGSVYSEHGTRCNSDDDPIPSEISSSITKKFAPNDVMNYGDDVDKILVTDLKRTKKFLETYVVEVFHPNFFWIHLRENKKRFNKMMDELQNFYILNKDKYIIAKVALKKDLNCACIFDGNWHRGIIKSVKPDFRVTVFFYDFGTVKAYAPEDIYYLHSKFSCLPAQAIPCGLYNVKPNVGDRWKRSVYEQFYDKVNETLLAATIITVDPPNNSMLVVLTDTSEEEDVCINNWLVKEKLAQFGKTGDAVDMASLMKYAVNNVNQKPSYCFAEESLMPENCYKATLTEEKYLKEEVPLVSSGLTLPHYDSQYQQQPVRPPPGFQPLDEQRIPSNASTRSFQNSYSFANPSNASNTKSLVFSDAQATTNPFLTDEQFIPNDVVGQLYITVWNENKKLHTGVNEILCDMLKCLSLSLKDQIQLNKILKIIKKILLEQKDDRSTVVKTSTASNLTSRTTLNDIDSTQKVSYNLNNETTTNQEPNINISSMSNPFNINVDDRLQNNTTFPYGSDSFSFKIGNWSQSDELNPRMQIPPSTTSPTPSMFINHVLPTSTFLPKTNQDSENVPLTPVSPAPMTSTNTNFFNNFSEVNNMNQFPAMFKDTNPFKFSMTDVPGTQVPEIQTERTVSNYDTGISYLSTKNLQSNVLKTETANIHAKNNGFTSVSNLGHVNESYTPKIVYESDPVMYNTQKKQTDVNVNTNVRQNACSSNFDNVQNAQSLKLEQSNKKLASQVSQSTKNIASLHTQHTVNNNIINNNIRDNSHSDENYVTRLSTYFMHGSQSTNGEAIYCHQNSNTDNLQTVSQSWNQFEIPDWTNSKFQSSIPLLNHSENTPITLANQDWNCDNDRKSIPRKNEVTNSNNIFKINDGYDKEGPMDIYANSWHNNEKGSVQNRNAAFNPFLFQKIDSVEGVTFIFHFEQDGWILTNEFVEVFTSFKLLSHLLTKIEMLNIKVTFKEILRSQYPSQFSQLDRYPLNVPRDSEKHILSIHLISLQTALALLHKLKIVSRDQIDNAFKKNEFLDDSVLRTLWTLILTYRDLKQRIEVYSNELNYM